MYVGVCIYIYNWFYTRFNLLAAPVLRSCRFALILFGFYAGMCLFLLRVNMSVAIVCMNNDYDNDTKVAPNDCPRQPDPSEITDVSILQTHVLFYCS